MKKELKYSILTVLTIFTILTSCTVKKHSFNRTEIIHDSIQITIDTSYQSKEVAFEIKSEDDSNTGELYFTEDDFNRYLDSLFSQIDTTYNKEQISEAIIKTKGLLNSDTSFLETSLASSHAVILNGKLFHFLHQKDTTLKQRYDSLLQIIKKERETWHFKEINESTEIVKKIGFNIKLIAVVVVLIFIGWIILKQFI